MEHDARRDRIIQDRQRISGCTVFDGLSCRNARARRNRVASLTGVTLDIIQFLRMVLSLLKIESGDVIQSD